ncbi:hypothetical protein EON65_55455 [archaeon]|nr:MAG: hypothetical protein EON65_55455 [archaeon]
MHNIQYRRYSVSVVSNADHEQDGYLTELDQAVPGSGVFEEAFMMYFDGVMVMSKYVNVCKFVYSSCVWAYL